MNPGQKIEINSQTTNEKIKRAAAALKQNSRPTKGNIKRQMKTCGTAKFKISKATWDWPQQIPPHPASKDKHKQPTGKKHQPLVPPGPFGHSLKANSKLPKPPSKALKFHSSKLAQLTWKSKSTATPRLELTDSLPFPLPLLRSPLPQKTCW